MSGLLLPSLVVDSTSISSASGNRVEDAERASGFLTGRVGAEVRQAGD